MTIEAEMIILTNTTLASYIQISTPGFAALTTLKVFRFIFLACEKHG